MFTTVLAAMPQVGQGGAMLATAGRERLPISRDVPTIQEALKLRTSKRVSSQAVYVRVDHRRIS